LKVHFSHTDGGLFAQPGTLKGFTMADPDQIWYPAEAWYESDAVVSKSQDVKQPLAVRYDWGNNLDGILYNGADLSARPFRTDH